jgi:SPP1 gp7 family putative phage head morphogenesis protein
MKIKKYTRGKSILNANIKQLLKMRIKRQKTGKQTIIFDKDKGWTRSKAKKWAKDNGYWKGTIRDTEKQVRIRQFPPEQCKEGSEYIQEFGDSGVSAVVCNRKEGAKQNDGAIDIPEGEYRGLYSEIRSAYGNALDDILKELAKHKPDFTELKSKGSKALNRSVIVAIITETLRKNELVRKVVEAITESVSGDMIATMQEQSTELDLGWDKSREEEAIARLTERRMSYYADIPDTLSDTVIQTLVDAIDQGESYAQAVDRLKILREDFTTHRAETIVRTEIGRSRKEATLMFAEQYEDLLDKQWVSTRDARTRPSHRAMNGMTVPIDQPFIVNYSLDNPKQPNNVQEDYPGQSKFGINCRCNLKSVRKKQR